MVTLRDDAAHEAELAELRQLVQKYQRAARKKELATEELVAAVYQAAKDAATAQPPIPKAPKVTVRKGTTAHYGLLHTTDWQCGKVTKDFNASILEARMSEMMDKTAILSERHGNPVVGGVVLLGGDMVEGVNIFPTQAWEVDAGLYEQVFNVVRIGCLVLDRALAIWPTVHVVSKWGNHGRIGRFGELPDPDNLDRIAYRIMWDRYKDDARVTWDVNSLDYVQRFTVGNYHGALLHGNEFNRSFSAQRIVQKLTAWQTLYGFGDTYIGHLHRRDCYGLPNGTMAYLTGSPESSNSYAADHLAAAGEPSQRLHFIDPDRGRINAEHILWLEAGRETQGR